MGRAVYRMFTASTLYVDPAWLGKLHVEYALVGCYCSFHRKRSHATAVKGVSAFTFSCVFVFYRTNISLQAKRYFIAIRIVTSKEL